MAHTYPQSWPHSPVDGVYDCIWCIWHIQTHRAGPTALDIWLYMVYMAYTDPQSWPHSPGYAVYCCIWCIWHIHTPRAGPTALHMLYNVAKCTLGKVNVTSVPVSGQCLHSRDPLPMAQHTAHISCLSLSLGDHYRSLACRSIAIISPPSTPLGKYAM